MFNRPLLSLTFFLLASLAVAGAGAAVGANSQSDATPIPAGAATAPGLVVLESPFGVSETMDRLEATLEENGIIVVARIDHAANAAGVGQELRPTQLLMAANPAVGTTLMQATQTIGIDLPQKFLAWEDETGQVYLAYNDPGYLAERHGYSEPDNTIQEISNALAMLTQAATTP